MNIGAKTPLTTRRSTARLLDAQTPIHDPSRIAERRLFSIRRLHPLAPYRLKMKALTGFSILAASLLVLAGCGPQQGSEGGDIEGSTGETINIDGSSTVYLVTAAVEEEFTNEHPNIPIAIKISGTGGGFKKFVEGTLDICDASRAIKEEEIEKCKENGVEYLELKVCYDGMAVICNPSLDFIDGLTVDQLKELWRPESPIKQWKDLNPEWPAEDIKLYGPDLDSGTFEYFTDKIVGKKKSSRDDFQRNADDNALARQIANDKNGIGYFGFAYYQQNKDTLKLLTVDGQTPSKETIQSLEYTPLSRPLFIYVNKKALERPEVQSFLQFYVDNCAELSEVVGYVRLREEEQAASAEVVKTALGSGE